MEKFSVEHPAHYTKGSIECIQAIKSSMSSNEYLAYCKGNVIKYMWRYEEKGKEEDLRKAKAYIDFMLEELSDYSGE